MTHWDYNHWGHPGEPGVGSGAELWAWMGHGRQYRRGTVFLIPPCEPDLPYSIDPRRKAFSLSGLFCTSLGSMDVLHTTSPAHAILPTSELPRPPAPARNAYTCHTTLPTECMCTGNLKPSLKLLPCPSHAGAAALLEPNRIFDVESPTGMVGRACVRTTPTATTARTTTTLTAVRTTPNVARTTRWRMAVTTEGLIRAYQ
ncbi:Gpi16 subunit, GPI transamidase component-domain-containing protein [Lactarius sanguifluus]|nr:Gpi16 subunit, GPI transamidase component-domain-containing protein [Lactarius sanguifluus]